MEAPLRTCEFCVQRASRTRRSLHRPRAVIHATAHGIIIRLVPRNDERQFSGHKVGIRQLRYASVLVLIFMGLRFLAEYLGMRHTWKAEKPNTGSLWLASYRAASISRCRRWTATSVEVRWMRLITRSSSRHLKDTVDTHDLRANDQARSQGENNYI